MKKNYKYSFNFWHRKLNMNVRNCYLSSAGKEIWKGLKMCRRYFHSGNGFRKSAKKFINSLKLTKSLLSFLNKLCNDDYRTALDLMFLSFVFCYFLFFTGQIVQMPTVIVEPSMPHTLEKPPGKIMSKLMQSGFAQN